MPNQEKLRYWVSLIHQYSLILLTLLSSACFSPLLKATQDSPQDKDLSSHSQPIKICFQEGTTCAYVLGLHKVLSQPLKNPQLMIQFIDAQSQAIPPPFDFSVQLEMPSMGHGSTAIEIIPVEGKVGAFYLRPIFFSMPGEWELQFLRKESGLILETVSIPCLKN